MLEETELEDENPLDQYRVSTNESALIPTIPFEANEESIILAPGEGFTPISTLADTHSEELAHLHIFSNGQIWLLVSIQSIFNHIHTGSHLKGTTQI